MEKLLTTGKKKQKNEGQIHLGPVKENSESFGDLLLNALVLSDPPPAESSAAVP